MAQYSITRYSSSRPQVSRFKYRGKLQKARSSRDHFTLSSGYRRSIIRINHRDRHRADGGENGTNGELSATFSSKDNNIFLRYEINIHMNIHMNIHIYTYICMNLSVYAYVCARAHLANLAKREARSLMK